MKISSPKKSEWLALSAVTLVLSISFLFGLYQGQLLQSTQTPQREITAPTISRTAEDTRPNLFALKNTYLFFLPPEFTFDYVTGGLLFNYKEVLGVYVPNLRLLGEASWCATRCYFADEDQVWYYEYSEFDGTATLIELSLDLGNLQVLSTNLGYASLEYVTDGNRTYLGGVWFKDVDVQNLQVIQDTVYLTDGQNIFTWDGLIEEADAATFEILERGFATDKDTVFYGGRVTGFERESFVMLNWIFVKDRTQVAYLHYGECDASFDPEPVEGADAESFMLALPGDFIGYGKDKNFVYRGKDRIEGSDPESLEYSDGILRDSNAVYGESLVLRGC